MKSLNVLKKSGLVALAIMLMMNVATAQSRYKHVPRTKVDRQHEVTVKTKEVKQTNTVTNEVVTPVTESASVTPVVTETNTEITTVASSTSNEVIVANGPVKTIAAKKEHKVKENKKGNHESFVNKLKEKSTLLKVKDVENTKMAKWLLWMIICLAIALLFTILAVVFAVTLSYSLYILATIFWILAGLAWVAALVFLILGLAGVM